MRQIQISEVNNGYMLKVVDTEGHENFYVFSSIEEFKMLEFIGKILTDKRVYVKG